MAESFICFAVKFRQGLGPFFSNLIKNIGRKLKVELTNLPPVQGTLIAADDSGFTLTWKQREPKPVGKGKVTVEKQQTLSYDQIESAKVTI